ncbi:MAG TPA: folylpolyglutamate synthase/dihydrofolate synthase family protein [Jiangellales bacterium]|nr:folylpolyglutamate synthase/dihydrofolate synthase family protein [Jiangellales bacterium]
MTAGGVVPEGLARVEAALAARWPESRIDPSLERMRDLVDLLGQPQRSYPVIHVAGTNGKTSTARIVDALLLEFGLRTGRATSPHLESVTERIALDGDPVEVDRLVAAFDELAPYLGLVDARHPGTPMSYFEVVTALAFVAFADAPVDVAVVEVGMGGTWDATNVADGQVAVITPVGLDHAEYLGDELADVAAEKAGIVKPRALAVVAQQAVEAAEVVLRRCVEVGATVAREGLEFGVRHRDVAVGGQVLTLQGLSGVYEELFLPLHGAHQAQNAACALAAVEGFLGGGRDQLDVEAVRAGFARVASPGRLELVRRSPSILVDAAHNPHGAHALVAALQESFSFTRLVGVVAVLEGKDAVGLLEALEPVLAAVVVTRNSSPRCLPAEDLARLAVEVFGPDRVEVAERLDDALDVAVGLAEEDSTFGGPGVLVTGSVVTAGDARILLGPGPGR